MAKKLTLAKKRRLEQIRIRERDALAVTTEIVERNLNPNGTATEGTFIDEPNKIDLSIYRDEKPDPYTEAYRKTMENYGPLSSKSKR